MSATLNELRAQYEESLAIYERLALETFDSSNTEDYEDTVERLYNQGYSDALQLAITLLSKEEQNASFIEGARYVLAELADLYDGITETDIYADFMNKESN